MSNEQVLEAFSQILDQEGLEQALAFLNASVPLRYTAVNRYAGLLMKSVGFHDALGEGRPSFLSAIPLDKSLAQFIKPGTPFRTDDSSKDERLVAPIFERFIFSYHGTALVTPAGHSWGVICHYDFAPIALSDDAFEILELVAPIVASFAVDPHR